MLCGPGSAQAVIANKPRHRAAMLGNSLVVLMAAISLGYCGGGGVILHVCHAMGLESRRMESIVGHDT